MLNFSKTNVPLAHAARRIKTYRVCYRIIDQAIKYVVFPSPFGSGRREGFNAPPKLPSPLIPLQ